MAATVRKILALLFALLLAGGCSQTGGAGGGTTFAVVPAAGYTPQPKQIVVTASSGMSTDMRVALDGFCEQVQTLSGGNLVAVARPSATPFADFKSGQAHVAFLSPAEAAAVSPEFAVCAEPFRYRNYEQFTMACNSEPVREALEASGESLDMRVLAGYYTGSTMLVSRIFLAGKKAYVPPDGSDRPIALTFSAETARGLEQLDFEVRTEPNALRRADLLIDGTVQLVELAFEELEQSGLADMEFHFVLSENNAAPHWLLASRTMLDSLLPVENAALLEASARLAGSIDAEYAARERRAVLLLQQSGAEIITDFTGNRAKITKAAEAADTDTAVTQFRKLLDSIG